MQWNKFFSRFDIDIAKFRPVWYGVEIEVPVIANGIGRGSITIDTRPFLLTRITHAVVGATFDWETTGLYQDGQYSINFRDESTNYQNIPLMSETMLGPVRSGHFLDLAVPLAYSGNRTFQFEVTNRYLRVLTPESDYFTVALTIHGVADWGGLQRSPT